MGVSMFESDKEKISYCIGLEIGRSLKDQFQGMDLKNLLLGVEHFMQGQKLLLSKEEIEATLKGFQQQMVAQEQKMLTQLSEDNKKQGDAFLEENKKKPNIISLDSGLQYQVITSGTGASPRPVDVVTTHYQGMLLDGTVFDSSYERAHAATFPVNRVIPGWTEALQLMKVGDKWRLFIPPHLAYGEHGAPPQIGPNATLIFDIELLGIN